MRFFCDSRDSYEKYLNGESEPSDEASNIASAYVPEKKLTYEANQTEPQELKTTSRLLNISQGDTKGVNAMIDREKIADVLHILTSIEAKALTAEEKGIPGDGMVHKMEGVSCADNKTFDVSYENDYHRYITAQPNMELLNSDLKNHDFSLAPLPTRCNLLVRNQEPKSENGADNEGNLTIFSDNAQTGLLGNGNDISSRQWAQQPSKAELWQSHTFK